MKLKITLLAIMILLSCSLFAQGSKKGYYHIIELKARVGDMGNLSMSFTPKKENRYDSLSIQVNEAMKGGNDPMTVLNELSKKNWELISVTQVDSSRPFILYYLRKYFAYSD